LISNHPNQADVVVLVTHLEYADGFPWFSADKVFGKALPTEEISYGGAWLIDCEQKILKNIH